MDLSPTSRIYVRSFVFIIAPSNHLKAVFRSAGMYHRTGGRDFAHSPLITACFPLTKVLTASRLPVCSSTLASSPIRHEMKRPNTKKLVPAETEIGRHGDEDWKYHCTHQDYCLVSGRRAQLDHYLSVQYIAVSYPYILLVFDLTE